MITISISADAYRALAGRDPEMSLRDEYLGGFKMIVDHATRDQLTYERGPARATATPSCTW